MDKLLSNKSRANFGALMALCCLMVMVGMAPFHLKVPVSDFWKNAGAILQLAAVMTLGIMMKYASSRVTPEELLSAAKEAEEEFKIVAEAWRGVQINSLKFKQLAWREKIPYLFFITWAVGLWIYAAFDLLGFFPQFKFKAIDGQTIVPPPLLVVGFEILIGAVALFLAHFSKVRIIDRYEETFKSNLKAVDDEWNSI